ncbi:MAG: hypothetical protein IJP17_06140, partial [Clostridia bacterium]|nr:hypothetical protein [Clostridia bacterium]
CSLLEDPDTQKFYGTWSGELDVTDYMNESLAEGAGEMADYLKVNEFTFVYMITFNEDGTYSTAVDEEALTVTMDNLKADLVAGVSKFYEDTAAQYDVTLEEFLEAAEMTTDDIVALVDESFPESMFTEMVEGFVSEGNFKVKEGKLFCSAGLEYNVDENVYETYEISENQLVLTDYVGGEAPEFDIYPMTLTRQ